MSVAALPLLAAGINWNEHSLTYMGLNSTTFPCSWVADYLFLVACEGADATYVVDTWTLLDSPPVDPNPDPNDLFQVMQEETEFNRGTIFNASANGKSL